MGSGAGLSIFSKLATSLDLALFERSTYKEPVHIKRLAPGTYKTFYYWYFSYRALAQDRFLPGVNTGHIIKRVYPFNRCFIQL